jgi:hypothetical protein
MSPADVAGLSDDVLIGTKALRERLRAARPALTRPVVRHILIQSEQAERAFAARLAQVLYGTRDQDERVIASRVAGRPLEAWRDGPPLLARLLGTMTSRGANAPTRVLRRLAAAILERQCHDTFDVVVVESSASPSRTGIPAPLIETGRRRGIVEQVIAVRTANAEASGTLRYPPPLYSGQIRVPSGRSMDVAVAAVAAKLLGRDLLSVATSAEPAGVPVDRTNSEPLAFLAQVGVPAAALLALAGTAYLMWPRVTGDEPKGTATAATTETGVKAPAAPPPPLPPAVEVALDALPWARFTIRPVDDGSTQAAVQGITPARIRLLPGEYQVDLENGGLTSALRGQRLSVGATPVQKAFLMPGFDADRAASQLLVPR